MTKILSLIISVFLLCCCVVPTTAKADWVSFSGAENAPNIAEIRIHEDHVTVELEIFVNDIVAFHRLVPDDYLKDLDIKRPSLEERMRRFSMEDFQIIPDEGQPLSASLNLIEPRLRKDRASPYAGMINPYTGMPIPGPPEDPRVLYAEIVYPFNKKPASLTFIPPMDEKGTIKVSLAFIAYHERVPIIDFRYLARPAKVTLDWDDPWYSEFEDKGLKRWQRGSVMSFLYIEPFEVRHEVLARVKDLKAWIDLGLRGEEFIEADENEPLKKRVGRFFLERDNVLIDGKKVQPILDRTAFVKYSMTGSTFLEKPERLPVNTAMVGVIITYLTDKIPQEVKSEWDLWSEKVQKVPADAIDPTGPFPTYVTPDDNVHVWINYLKKYRAPSVAKLELDESLTTMKIPLASALCFSALLPLAWLIIRGKKRPGTIALYMGIATVFVVCGILVQPYLQVAVTMPAAMAPAMSEPDALALLNDLLKNTYRSFDFRLENDVYDRLAISVSGDLLTDIYLQNRKSLAVTQAGGAQARVEEVEILDADIHHLEDPPLALLFRAEWTAMGSVGHWGHVHIRKNQYEADITVEPVDGAWKITGMELLDEKRIDQFAPQQG